MTDTPNRGIPYVPEATLDPAAGLNLALNVIDALLQTAVISMAETAPPVTNADGDLYIVAAPATGAWALQEDNLARFVAEGSFWQFYTAGSQVFYVINRADGNLYKFQEGSPADWILAAGIADAPNDGLPYWRRSGAWELAIVPVFAEADEITAALATDEGIYTRFSHSTARYEFSAAESYQIGSEFHGRYVGVGTLTIAGETGFTINAPAGGTLVIPPQGTFTVKIVAADAADLFGVTVPV